MVMQAYDYALSLYQIQFYIKYTKVWFEEYLEKRLSYMVADSSSLKMLNLVNKWAWWQSQINEHYSEQTC